MAGEICGFLISDCELFQIASENDESALNITKRGIIKST